MRPRSDTLFAWTGSACSYGCGACPLDEDSAGLQLAPLLHSLTAVPARLGRLVILLGGEPFLRPDILRLLAGVRGVGCVPGVITTGGPLVYPQLREKLRRVGLAYLRLQLFGAGASHDRVTATPDGFARAVRGVQLWLDETPACAVDIALSPRGRTLSDVVAEIDAVADALARPQLQLIVALDPHRVADLDAETWQRLAARFATWNDDAARPLLAWEGLPHAAPPGLLRSVPLQPSFVGGTPPASCLGRTSALAQASPDDAAQPCANSFNFVRTGAAVPYATEARDCMAYTAASPRPGRDLWLVENDRLLHYASDSGDFSDDEIAHVKDDLSHLFVDRSPPGVLDDFIEGMRRVLPDATCEPCPQRGSCARRFAVVDGAPYAQQEARIVTFIAALRGRVLDVGCGEQLYQSELLPLVRGGQVEYHGLDPDESSLSRLRGTLPQGHYYLGGIEQFRPAAQGFDRILCLRALNHVLDLDEAVGRMAEMLMPGGQLLLVECTPWAMLRDADQVAGADQAPRAGHQHFRNVASDAVLPLARRRGLRVVEHQPSSRSGTNQWLLLLERPGDDRA